VIDVEEEKDRGRGGNGLMALVDGEVGPA
jgi:hypothetical protein